MIKLYFLSGIFNFHDRTHLHPRFHHSRNDVKSTARRFVRGCAACLRDEQKSAPLLQNLKIRLWIDELSRPRNY